MENHKPVIETIVNTAAIALAAFGTNLLLQKDYFGFLLILFAMGLEYLKYYGRKQKLW